MDLENLASAIFDWYSNDMGTWFDEMQGNEEEVYNEILSALENIDENEITSFISDMEEMEDDDDYKVSTVPGYEKTSNILNALKELLSSRGVKTESKELKKENPQDDAVYSFFDQMDKYMDSKGTDGEALKGIETTANDLAQYRPEFADMRYGDIYRALEKEYVRESKITEAQLNNLNELCEVLKVENYTVEKLEEGLELDDEETKFINNMINRDRDDIEDFLGYELTDETFNDKQHLRLAIKEIYEQMPDEELSKFECKTESVEEDNVFVKLYNEWHSKLVTEIPELKVTENNPQSLLNCIKAEDLQYKFRTKNGADVSVDVELKLEKTNSQYIEVLQEEVTTPYTLVCHIINSFSDDKVPAEKSVVGGVIAVENDGEIKSYPLNPSVLTTDIDNCVEWLKDWVSDNIDVLSTVKLENCQKDNVMYQLTETKSVTNRARKLKKENKILEEANQKYKATEIKKALTDGKVVKVGNDKGAYTPTSFYYNGDKLYYNNKDISFGWNEHTNTLEEIVKHIYHLNSKGFEVTFLDEKPEIKDERFLGPSDEVINKSKAKGLYTEAEMVKEPTNFEFDKYSGIIEPDGKVTYNIGTSKNKTGNTFNYDDEEDTAFPHTDNQKVKMYIKKNVLKTEGLSKEAEDVVYSVESFNELLDLLDNMLQTDKVVKARNLVSHTFTHISDEEEDEKLEDIKDEVINILTESNKLEEKYYLVGIYTDEHGMEKKEYIEGAYNKEYLDKYMEEHEEELKARDYDMMVVEDNDNKDLVVDDDLDKTLTESLRDGWNPKLELYKKLMKEIQDNLGISEYEIQKEADNIKFRYNGKVYFAEPRSSCQVDIFDDNHKKIGYGVVTDKIKQEVFTDYITNQDFLYQFVGGEYAGTYTREEAEKLPIREPELTADYSKYNSDNPDAIQPRKELQNQFQFNGYLGPMWGGIEDGKAVIRYETPEVYDMLSR